MWAALMVENLAEQTVEGSAVVKVSQLVAWLVDKLAALKAFQWAVMLDGLTVDLRVV